MAIRARPGRNAAFRVLKAPRFLASSLSLKKPERIMALLRVMTVCLLVYAALEYRIRQALKDHDATFPNQTGQPVQNPTARWVFQYFVGIHVLLIPGEGALGCSISQRRMSACSDCLETRIWGFMESNIRKIQKLCAECRLQGQGYVSFQNMWTATMNVPFPRLTIQSNPEAIRRITYCLPHDH